MTFDLRLFPEAEQDLLDAATWYEGQRQGLGHEFLDEILRAFADIADTPLMYPEVHRDIRRALLRRFPFGVFFRIESRSITVLAVMHASRDPRRWKSRSG